MVDQFTVLCFRDSLRILGAYVHAFAPFADQEFTHVRLSTTTRNRLVVEDSPGIHANGGRNWDKKPLALAYKSSVPSTVAIRWFDARTVFALMHDAWLQGIKRRLDR